LRERLRAACGAPAEGGRRRVRLIETWPRVTDSKPMSTELESEGIRLRRLSVDDAPSMHSAAVESAAELETTMPWFSRGMTVESFRAFATWAWEAWDRGEHYELSILAQDGTYLGSAGLSVDATTMSANLQYWVRTSATRRGVASESTRLVSRWAIQAVGLQRVEIFISDHNLASQMAARKSGAHFEGVLRNKIRWGGRAYDAHVFSFVPGDFT
jgi:ribosomal-protein-serine acetyltransferase